MPFTALVIDDEPYARDELIYILSHFQYCQVIGQADSAEQAISIYRKLKSDVLFLDIELPDMSGIETARVISKFYSPPLIVFATAYDEYAIEAFELGAIDYILKPFEEKRIEKTLKRIENLKRNQSEWSETIKKLSDFVNAGSLKKLPVQRTDGIINLIPYREILFGEACGGKRVKIVTSKGEYFFDGTLTDLDFRLKKEGFLRVHKSFIVNLKRVEAVIPWFKGTYWVVIEGQKVQIPVSKSLVKELKDILGLKYN
ncbi:MAG: LytTR family DNA-binding domain-containing protein [Thermodesulfovibrio sp.]|nr:LytTR family DNA-binding domain-containing protein [Thermodesulfovibrio sp.]